MLTDETTQYSQQKERFFDSHRLKQAKVFRTQKYLITHCCALRDPMIRLLSPIGGKSNELNSPHNSLYFVDCPQSRSKVLCLFLLNYLVAWVLGCIGIGVATIGTMAMGTKAPPDKERNLSKRNQKVLKY